MGQRTFYPIGLFNVHEQIQLRSTTRNPVSHNTSLVQKRTKWDSLKMKSLIIRVFNLTVGKVIRLFQGALAPPHTFQGALVTRNFPQGVFHLINQQALQDSAQYAIDNFSNAMQFNTQSDLWSYCLNRIPQLQTGGGSLLSLASIKERRSTFSQKVALKPGYLDLTLSKA